MPVKRKLRVRVDADLFEPSFLETLKSLKRVRVDTVGSTTASDEDILSKANVDNYHVITRNCKDFLRLFKDQTLKVGVIGIETEVSLNKIVSKVNKLLSLLGHEDVHNRFYKVNNRGCRIYCRRSTKSKFINWRNIENVLSN